MGLVPVPNNRKNKMSKKNKTISKKIKKSTKAPFSSKVLDEMIREADDFPPIATNEELETIKDFYQQHPEININLNAWIQTYTGKKFYLQNPTLDSIDIIDIAHSLSQICRYTGHSSVFHSVAHHSVLVSYLCNKENALQGLLHDSSEAMGLNDLASPIKNLPELAGYKKLEKRVQSAIYRKFGLSEEEPVDVKQADLLVLSIESNSFMQPLNPDWKIQIIPTLKIDPLSPTEAEELFLKRFWQLCPSIDI
jgi:5'-deoxynucleotidase YfbR-like HD superfamily hydrolase